MKPYGRQDKKVKGGFPWKQNVVKKGNWWEEFTDPTENKTRRRVDKQNLKKKRNED